MWTNGQFTSLPIPNPQTPWSWDPTKAYGLKHLSRVLGFHNFCSGCVFRAQSTHYTCWERWNVYIKCTAQLQLNQWDFLPHSKGNGMQQTILAALNFWICCFARFFIVLFGINFASYPSASSFRLSVCKQGVASVVAALFGLEASLTNMSRNEAWALGAPPRNKFSASLTSLTKTDCH